MFDAQAARSPDAIALLCEDESLTYAELAARANRLAHHLHAMGVGPETVVGLCFERSVDMVVGLPVGKSSADHHREVAAGTPSIGTQRPL